MTIKLTIKSTVLALLLFASIGHAEVLPANEQTSTAVPNLDYCEALINSLVDLKASMWTNAQQVVDTQLSVATSFRVHYDFVKLIHEGKDVSVSKKNVDDAALNVQKATSNTETAKSNFTNFNTALADIVLKLRTHCLNK